MISSTYWENTNFNYNIEITCIGIDSSNHIRVGSSIGSYSFSNKWRKDRDDSLLVNNIKVLRFENSGLYLCYIIYNNIIDDNSFIYEYFGNGYQIFGRSLKSIITSLVAYNKYYPFISVIGDSIKGGVNIMDFSEDSGWRPLNNGLPVENDSIKALDIINKNDTLFVALSNGLYYSTNDGEIWLPVSFFNGLEVDKFVLNTKNDLYFIVSGTAEKSGLYKNNVKIFDDVLPLSAVAINRNDDVFVSSSIRGRGVLWTSDNGTDWQEMYDGLDSCEITALICDLDGYIYAGTNGQGIYKSLKSTTKVDEIAKDELFVSPNPFSEKTRISFNLENSAYTKIIVYNSLGFVIDVLTDEYLSEGLHEFTFDGSALASGTYYYVLQADGKVETGKLVLIK
ncbi:MAG: T9SS type A sorting domain-containing protein [bacterium]